MNIRTSNSTCTYSIQYVMLWKLIRRTSSTMFGITDIYQIFWSKLYQALIIQEVHYGQLEPDSWRKLKSLDKKCKLSHDLGKNSCLRMKMSHAKEWRLWFDAWKNSCQGMKSLINTGKKPCQRMKSLIKQEKTHAKDWKVWYEAGKKITWLKDFNHIIDSDGYNNLPVLSCKAVIQWGDYHLNKYVCIPCTTCKIYLLHFIFQCLIHSYFRKNWVQSVQVHCQEGLIYVFPKMKLSCLVPNFNIHVSVND